MVVAALLRILLNGECCCCNSKYRLVTLNPFYSPKDKEQRQNERRREWNIWLSSTADDLDLFADWWFFRRTYDGRGGFADQLTFVLFIFCCAGTLTWFLELVQLSCVRRNFTWTWLPLMIVCVEDIPQMVITLLLGNRFSNLTPLSLFNLVTSFYSMMIRVAGELFMNCCYCYEKVQDDEEEQRGNRYSHLP